MGNKIRGMKFRIFRRPLFYPPYYVCDNRGKNQRYDVKYRHTYIFKQSPPPNEPTTDKCENSKQRHGNYQKLD